MDHNSKNGNQTDPQILMQPNNELDSGGCHSVVEIFSKTIANEAELTKKNHGAHRNVNGAGFFEQDTLFESQYNLRNNISDEMDRVTQIVSRSEELLKISRSDEKPWDLPDIIDLEAAIRLLRKEATKY